MKEKNKKLFLLGAAGLWVLAIFLAAALVALVAFGYLFFFKSETVEKDAAVATPVSVTEKKLIYHLSVKDDAEKALNGAHEFWRNGNYLYITSVIDHGLEIMDVTDPSQPEHVGAFFDTEATLMRKPHSVSFLGNYAFVGSMEDSAIQALDISNPAKPLPVASISDNESMGLKGLHGTSIYQNYLYVVGTGENALTVLDVSNPREMKHIKTIFDSDAISLDAPHNMVFRDNYAYIITAKEGVQIMDVSNPADPQPVSAFTTDHHGHTMSGGHDIKLFGNYLVTASYVDGLNFFDRSDPRKLVEISEIHPSKENGLEGAADMNIAGNNLFVASEVGSALAMVDIADPKNPAIKDVLKDDGSGEMFLWNGHSIYSIGEYVYVSGLQNGFGIVRYVE